MTCGKLKAAWLTLGFKKYYNQANQLERLTLRIRCFQQTDIAQDLAEKFGGGGHPFAAGVKWQGGPLDLDKIKQEVYDFATQLLKKKADETL